MSRATLSTNSDSLLKQCNICHGWFEKTAFPPGRARCRDCHRDRSRELASAWRSRLKHEYGITPKIHEMMYRDQEGKCHFCGDHKPRRGHSGLVIDHDKDTGLVRGLLCRTCNANWVDEYDKLPPELRDSRRTNAYLCRGKTGDYIERIKQRLASDD